jgi:hypothetical protein
MKRRLLVAVLLALAIVALAGRAVATGADAGAGEIQGQPWTGSPGVTEGVATLQDRQRAEDRRTAGQPQTIREKPEPGEGAAGPKAPGAGTSQQRVGQAAIGANSSLSAGTSFLGAQVSESGFVPPDSMGSVGPTQVLVDVNGRIKSFDKQGNLGALNVTDDTFWTSVCNCSSSVNPPTDPGVEYDRLSGRWIISAINEESSNNRVMIAVSSGSTITSQSSFTFFEFPENFDGGDAGLFADYPQLGVDANAVYIGVNDFSGNSFAHSSAFVIRKSSVLASGPIVVTAFRNLTNGSGGPGPFSPQPAQDMDPSVAQGYIVGLDAGTFSQLDVRRISNPGGTPAISGNLSVSVPTTANPLGVPASGSHHNLDALDTRLFEAMIGRAPDGTLSLWTAHNIRVNSSGVGSSVGDRDGSRWYQLGNLTSNPPTLTQSGTLFDPTVTTTPRFFWIPSIAMNGQGYASLNASTSSSNSFASVALSAHLPSDGVGVTETPDINPSSSSSYNIGLQNGIYRWGDYSQTVVDPTDNMTFWTFQEYANAKNSWGVRVIKVNSRPPATPASVSPSTIPTGQSSVTVQVTGTQMNGSGFFDPNNNLPVGDPGFPTRINASVSGGVTVNSVTYTDPTHVTLDLNTTAASSGTQDVTITNPDGQSTTGFNLLSVGSGLSAPALIGTNPGSPANNNNPEILGSAQSGTTVNLFTNSSCTGPPVASDTAANFASPGIAVSVADNTTTTFYAAATDGADTSACSSTRAANGSVTYVEDSSPPAAPTSLSASPTSPANDNNPVISGTAESGSTVNLYTNSTCTSPVAASGSASSFASPGFTAPVADNSTTTFYATATDAAGNTSSCSSSSVTYIEDSIPPTAPTVSSTNPASPSSSTTPKVIGSSSSDTTTVQIFTQANCGGSVQVSGSKATFESTGIQVTVGSNTTTSLSAKALDAAGNASACSNNLSYTSDSIPPTAPTVSSTNPASPSSSTTPKVIGSSSSDTTTVQIFTQANCGGSVQVSGSKATFESTGIQVTVGSNTTTSLSAKALDAAGNASACSNNLSYTQDSTLPAAPTFTGTSPVSPGNTTTPRVTGAADPGTTVKIYKAPTDSDCTAGNLVASGTDANFASPGITVTVPPSSTTTFRATATDAASNVSPCSSSSVTYTVVTPAPLDTIPPETTITREPKQKTTKRRPKFAFASSELGSTFQCQVDKGEFETCSSPFKPPKLRLGKHVFRVEAVDPAGNVDPTPAVRKFKVIP